MTTVVADVVADELHSAGVRRVFGLPGGEVLVLMDALRRRGIDFALFRHEAHAGIAAAVYGRLSGTCGVVVTTLGPGACNLMLPIANSYLDCDPLLAVSAQIPSHFPPSHTHQRLALEEVFRPITKYTANVTGSNGRAIVREAIDRCCAEPMGPSFLTLTAEEAGKAVPRESEVTKKPRMVNFGPPAGAATAAANIGELLRGSKRPLVIVGLGVRPACAEPLGKWLEAWSLPFAVTAKAKGMVDETSPAFVGVVGGMAMDGVMREAVKHADLLLGWGLDPVEIDQTWHAETPIHWILEAPLATERVPEHRLVACRHRDVLEVLNREAAPASWLDSFADFRHRRWPSPGTTTRHSETGLDPVVMIRRLGEALPEDTIVVTDVGSHKYLFGQFWPSRRPETFLVSNGLSAMGYGLPAAIGAKMARPDQPVLLAIGDGGFAMTSQELETAFRLDVPVVALVLADQSYSLIRLAQESRGLPNFGVDFGPMDTVAMAKAAGVPGKRIASIDEVTREVAGALASRASLVVEVPVAIASYRGVV